MEGRRWDGIRGPGATRDPVGQYELFVRNLLDFEDWQRARSTKGRNQV